MMVMGINIDDYGINPKLYGCETTDEVSELILESERKRSLNDDFADMIYRRDLFGSPDMLAKRYKTEVPEKQTRRWYDRFLDVFIW